MNAFMNMISIPDRKLVSGASKLLCKSQFFRTEVYLRMDRNLVLPTKWVEGKYSGVDLSRKVVVCVCDVALDRGLYYQVGVINQVSEKTTWGDSTKYDTGQYPSVALIMMGDKLYAIETHFSDIFNSCYYTVGEVKTEDKSIQWGSNCRLGRGKNPKIAANDNGVVIAVKEMSWDFFDRFKLVIGTFDPSTKQIAWKPELTVPDFCGVEPDVAINLKKIVIACRNYGKVRFKMGNIKDDYRIGWVGASCDLQGGRSPSIALNSRDAIVEVHQSWTLRRLSNCTGQVLEDSIQWGEVKVHDYGEYPCISLSDDGTYFEVHKTNFGTNLFYRNGELRN